MIKKEFENTNNEAVDLMKMDRGAIILQKKQLIIHCRLIEIFLCVTF
jgi:hypothetical protein